MKKVAIIGHFGGKESFCDGQTVKTKNLERLLASQSDITIRRVDTYLSRSNKVKLLAETIDALIDCEYVFLLVSENGMKVYLPLLHYLNFFTRKHIYHYVIGSELLSLVEQDRRLVDHLNSLDANWFEYESGTQRLREYGVENVITVPNFKEITPVERATAYCVGKRPYPFCTFSRVMREKGITDAIETVARINREQSDTVVFLDVYGPIDPSYQKEFEQLLECYSDCVTYKGIADSSKSVEILKDYYALLFPTRWPGEGMPGTVLDAFASGIPVIASDWNANKEIIGHMKQGVIYPSAGIESLYDAVMWSIEHVDELNKMRTECRNHFTKYMPESVLAIIRKSIG